MLEWALKGGLIERFGKGRKKSPYRYALQGKTFRPFGLDDRDIPAMNRERYGC